MRARGALIVVTLMATMPACGGAAEEARFSAPSPAQARSFRWAVEDFTVSGATMAVVDGDGRSWSTVAGVAGPGTDAPVTLETRFAIASITKTFTATLALRLASRGVLDLDAPSGLRGDHGATVRDLLGHTAGLTYPAIHLRTARWTEDEWADAASIDRVCEPGRCFGYSDLGFVGVGLVIERVTGERLHDLYQRELFDPLHLAHTALVEPGSIPAGIAASDEVYEGSEASAVPMNTWSAGAIVTTATDLARFGRALFAGEILRADALAEMLDVDRSADLPCDDGCERPYGLGISLRRIGGHRAWEHSGSSGAELAHFIDEDITIAVLPTRPATGRPIMQRLMAEGIPALAELSDLFMMNADGSGVRRLTTDPAVDSSPSWSPDGTSIAFQSTSDGKAALFVLDLDTGSERRVTPSNSIDQMPAWIPDGSTIVFTRKAGTGSELYAIRPDGTGLRQITDLGANVWSPAISPDGSMIAFEVDDATTHQSHIAVIGIDGHNQRVIRLHGGQVWPTWSPDGKKLAFWRPSDGLFVTNADGTDEHAISPPHSNDTKPSWGPDGTIAFVQGGDIWTMDADGADRRQLTDTDEIESRVAWSPDGTQLVFASDRS